MKLLMIAYEFPPAAAGGVFRSVKFARYLPRFGWTPHVLTPSNTTVRCQDETLLNELPPEVVVHRSRSFEYRGALGRGGWLARGLDWRIRALLDRLAVPDPMSFWAVPAVIKALWIIHRHRIDALYSTSWPFSDHLAGLILHRLTGLPWIADFRDPWLQHYNYGPTGTRKDRWNRRIERAICRRASAVISPTVLATRAMRRSHPDLPPGRFLTIRNGYDECEFTGRVAPSEDFLIVHAGSFYGTRNPQGFFDGLNRFLRRNPQARERLRIVFLGTSLDGAFAPPDLDGRVEYKPWVSHAETIQWLRQARVLLLIQHRDPAVKLTVTGKLYEYMATGCHILSLNTQPCENESLLRRYGRATVLSDSDPNAVASALQHLHHRYVAGHLGTDPLQPATEKYVRRFRRQATARQLADLLNRALADAQAPRPVPVTVPTIPAVGGV
ncbi:MAG TPA: glycosyltransferase [Phycisphaerae bacterium]|nr:glycosyltransferase [Phycisphaerae bacterium]